VLPDLSIGRKVCLAAICCAAVLAGGCKRKEPPRREAAYRSSIKVPASVLTVEPDPGVIADQEALARLWGPEVEETEEGPVEQVRGLIREILDEISRGTGEDQPMDESIAGYFVRDDAELIRQAIRAQAPVLEKLRGFREALELEFGPEAAAEIGGEIPGMAGESAGPAAATVNPRAILPKAAELQPEDLELTEADGRVLLALGQTGMQIAFVEVDGAWKIDLPEQFDAVLRAMPSLAKAYSDFLDELIAGLDGGSVTKENISEAMALAYQKHVVAAMQEHAVGLAGGIMKGPETEEAASPLPSPEPAGEQEESPQEHGEIEPVETQPASIEPVEQAQPTEKPEKKRRGGKIGLILSPLDRAMEQKSQP